MNFLTILIKKTKDIDHNSVLIEEIERLKQTVRQQEIALEDLSQNAEVKETELKEKLKILTEKLDLKNCALEAQIKSYNELFDNFNKKTKDIDHNSVLIEEIERLKQTGRQVEIALEDLSQNAEVKE